MSIAQSICTEFEAQAPITRKFLERLPEDRLTWKPHEKSMSAGQLALHIARTPGGVVRFVQQNPAQATQTRRLLVEIHPGFHHRRRGGKIGGQRCR